MNPDRSDLKQALGLQAYVDREISARERCRVEAVMLKDPKARDLVRSLGGISELIRAGEPEACLTESREFYWSAIERQIRREAVVSQDSRGFACWVRGHGWLRWALPALGAVVVGVLLLVLQPSGWRSATVAALSLNREVESVSEDTSTFTFRSVHSGMSVVWVQVRQDF